MYMYMYCSYCTDTNLFRNVFIVKNIFTNKCFAKVKQTQFLIYYQIGN